MSKYSKLRFAAKVWSDAAKDAANVAVILRLINKLDKRLRKLENKKPSQDWLGIVINISCAALGPLGGTLKAGQILLAVSVEVFKSATQVARTASASGNSGGGGGYTASAKRVLDKLKDGIDKTEKKLFYQAKPVFDELEKRCRAGSTAQPLGDAEIADLTYKALASVIDPRYISLGRNGEEVWLNKTALRQKFNRNFQRFIPLMEEIMDCASDLEYLRRERARAMTRGRWGTRIRWRDTSDEDSLIKLLEEMLPNMLRKLKRLRYN